MNTAEIYETRLDRINQVAPKPTSPITSTSRYPHTLKVHLADIQDGHALAEALCMPLSTSERRIVFRADVNQTASFTITKQPHRRIPTKYDYWQGMPTFTQKDETPKLSFDVQFDTQQDLVAFVRRIKQRITLNTKSIWYPKRQKDKKQHLRWVSDCENVNPQYPVYIVSKGRGDSRLTSRALDRLGVPYYMVIEPQDYDAYACVIDPKKILVLPFSNHGKGPGPARNWCWDHSIGLGAERHWVLDDNISDFYRLENNRRLRVGDGAIFRAAEDFVDRYENIDLAGFHYRFFVEEKTVRAPVIWNTRIYSCLLIHNDCSHRWRGQYNEDTDLSLNILKDGRVVCQFTTFLQEKLRTSVLKGGNTDEFYDKEGTWNKSAMLAGEHPDVAQVVWRYGRWHHHVDYSSFKNNMPILRNDAVVPSEDPYQMRLINV